MASFHLIKSLLRAPEQVRKCRVWGWGIFCISRDSNHDLSGRPAIDMASFHLIKCLLQQQMFQAELDEIIFRLPKTSLNAKLDKKQKIGRPKLR